MLKKRLRLTKNQKGMTLIELLAVVVILGILAAVAATAVVRGFNQAEVNATATTEAVVQEAVQRAIFDGDASVTFASGTATVTIAALHTAGYLRNADVQHDGQALISVTVTQNATTGALTFTTWNYS